MTGSALRLIRTSGLLVQAADLGGIPSPEHFPHTFALVCILLK